jgi:four helix bundle protein
MKTDTQSDFILKPLVTLTGSYDLAMDVYNLSKTWPPEEKYSLTDQIRRSARSVCVNLREAWSKRRYEAHFLSKLADADGQRN